VNGSKASSTSASIVVQVATSTLSCPNFGYLAPVVTLTDTGLENGTAVNVSDTVAGLPSKKGVLICYQPVESSPLPVLLGKCHGRKFSGACVKSVKEEAGSVVAQLLVPAGDPRFHIGGASPEVTSFSPASPRPGKKLTIKGANLSEVTGVTIGGVSARVVKTAPTKVSVITPTQAHGAIVVTSLAGVTASTAIVTVG
jgi:IPT/TIG domain